MAQVDKVKRYDWAAPGDSGQQLNVALDALKIDHSYQRTEVSRDNTLATAREFNWSAFGAIVAMQRVNGDIYVVDGQQRVLAARRRGDITHVPCILFGSKGPKHEAAAFRSLNIYRKFVSSFDKYKSGVLAEESPETEIDQWVRSVGLTVARSHDGTSHIVDFPALLVRLWKQSVNASQMALLVQREINGDEPLHSAIHKGLWWLARSGVELANHVSKIQTGGGKTAMLGSIRKLQIESDQKGLNPKICGLGILRLINYKRRTRKIRLPLKAGELT